jgi:hypothetical protein
LRNGFPKTGFVFLDLWRVCQNLDASNFWHVSRLTRQIFDGHVAPHKRKPSRRQASRHGHGHTVAESGKPSQAHDA